VLLGVSLKRKVRKGTEGTLHRLQASPPRPPHQYHLLTGEKSEAKVDTDGKLELTIEKQADYRLLRYELK
jgi:hypothetical protein